jgi:amino-acid N-acetyltransferase
LDKAREDRCRSLYLLTTTAARFFERFGFRPAERVEVPSSVRRSVEFRGACPESAVLMRLDLQRPPNAPTIRPRSQSVKPLP